MSSSEFQAAPSRLRPPAKGFRCGERRDKDGPVGQITFVCNELSFSCREPSCGVLVGEEEPVVLKTEDDEEHAMMDPNFWDSGYTLAGKTGFQVWAGSRLLLEALTLPDRNDCAKLKEWQEKIRSSSSLRILELGSGVGVVGASLAFAGAQILMTDLPTLVENAIRPNLSRNETTEERKDQFSPFWLQSSNPVKIGQGWAGATALDWTRPVDEQLHQPEMKDVDLIIASDCVWLVSMLDSLLSTVSSIFHHALRSKYNKSPKLLLSFQRRDTSSSDGNMFATVDFVLNSIRERSWLVECLAWCHILVASEKEGIAKESKEVFVFEVSPDS